jgi:hypothetical protein
MLPVSPNVQRGGAPQPELLHARTPSLVTALASNDPNADFGDLAGAL